VLQEKIDADEEGVTQDDLFQLKTGRYPLDKGLIEARLGRERALRGLRFALSLSDTDSVRTREPRLQALPELPPLDSLRENFTPTDLKQLEAGLEARKSMLEVSRAEQGPEIFLFAKFDYTKAWVDNRTGDNQDVLITDPINSVSGALGIGFKWNVNWWIQQTKVRKADLEYQQLRRKEAYAKKGLTLLMEDAWLKYQALGEQLQAIDSSRTLAEGWLKSVAVSMDIDPSRAKDLVGPYKTWIDFESKYWEAVYQRNLAALDVLDQAGWLLRASEQLR
jgi:outer membrane protein TolC